MTAPAFECLACTRDFPCPDLPYSDSEPCCPYCESAEIMEIEVEPVVSEADAAALARGGVVV